MCYSLSPLSHQMETDEGLPLNPDALCFVPKIQHIVELHNPNATGEEETTMCPITRTTPNFSPPLDTSPPLTTTGTPPVIPDLPSDDQQSDNPSPDSEPLELPTITFDDYTQDPEFKDIYNYIVTGELTDNELINRQTLLISEQYFARNNLLYKIGLPRSNKLNRVQPVSERLCIPKIHRGPLIAHSHDKLGHYALQRQFLTLYPLMYWKQMYLDIKEYCNSCEICLRAKRNSSFRTTPLHPLPVPHVPFQQWQIDHKNLTRKTKLGNVAILCIVDSFSTWPILVPCT